jgi:polysaccharide biosynthesis protein PslH
VSLRILFLSSYPASPATYGGQRRLEGLMSSLARDHEVSAVALVASSFDPAACEQAMRRYCRDVVLVPEGRGTAEKRLLQARALVSRRSFETRYFALPALQRALDRVLTTVRYDLVVVSAAVFMSVRLRQAPDGEAPPRTVLDEHNIEFDLQRQLSRAGGIARRLHYVVNWRKVRREEVGHWRAYDGVTFTSGPDQARALALVPSVRSAVVPNAVDVTAFQPVDGDPPPDGVTVMFFGINDYYPNTDGILFFIRSIWPAVAASHPRARLKIVGPNPTAEILALRSDRVEIAGKVDDLRLHLASASVMVVPLRLGGGTRFKVLEAMAMGKAVVSTSIGAEGIDVVDGKHLLIAEEPSAFAAAVGRVLDDPDLAARLGREARALACARYSWDAAAERMIAFCREVVAAPVARVA